MDIRIVAGLGNPGREYEGTRHNVGFALLDRFAESRGRVEWRRSREAMVAEASGVASSKVLLMKPQSFMNLSGGPIAEVVRFYKFSPRQLLVVHDDIDLALGTVRVKVGGGDGGHNGIRSIAACLGDVEFVRLRVGVGRPGEASGRPRTEVVGWVLGRFGREESSLLDEVLERGVQAIDELMSGDIASAQRKFN